MWVVVTVIINSFSIAFVVSDVLIIFVYFAQISMPPPKSSPYFRADTKKHNLLESNISAVDKVDDATGSFSILLHVLFVHRTIHGSLVLALHKVVVYDRFIVYPLTNLACKVLILTFIELVIKIA